VIVSDRQDAPCVRRPHEHSTAFQGHAGLRRRGVQTAQAKPIFLQLHIQRYHLKRRKCPHGRPSMQADGGGFITHKISPGLPYLDHKHVHTRLDANPQIPESSCATVLSGGDHRPLASWSRTFVSVRHFILTESSGFASAMVVRSRIDMRVCRA
jgi:hypothetical protein